MINGRLTIRHIRKRTTVLRELEVNVEHGASDIDPERAWCCVGSSIPAKNHGRP